MVESRNNCLQPWHFILEVIFLSVMDGQASMAQTVSKAVLFDVPGVG